MRTEMLKLTLALRMSLVTHLPALAEEVNQEELDANGDPYVPIVMPHLLTGETYPVALGIRTDMLKRELEELPAISCGVYLRTPVSEGEQDYSEVVFPYTIDIYLGSVDADALYIQALKWALVLDMWNERYGKQVVPGFTVEEAPDIDISYSLELRGGEFRQLVTATGIFQTHE